MPTYAFFDDELNERVSVIQQRLPGLWSRLASWSTDFSRLLFEIEASDKDTLRAISPAYFADSFQAPVLLLHGEKDTRVHIDQSKRMNSALRRADKEETRIEALRATAEFIEQHL